MRKAILTITLTASMLLSVINLNTTKVTEYTYQLEENNAEIVNTVQELPAIPEKSLDWTALNAVSEDIYAWIYIPNTYVDYPILQHPTDPMYYLNYNLDGTKGYPGCICSQYYNTKEFNDPNTILYGHNMKNGTMFRTLHYYEKEDFFNDNPYIYIYTPETTYIYEIFATNIVTNEHLMSTYNFWNYKSFNKFLSDVTKSSSSICHVRKGSEAQYGDYLLTLSTCLGQDDKRYIVVAKRLN